MNEILFDFRFGFSFRLHLEVYILTNVANSATNKTDTDPNGKRDEYKGQN